MEIDNVVVEEVTPEVVVEEVKVDAYESEARDQGWRPKEEWEGDPEKWRPAKEFVERGELFGKIDTLGRELKETKKALKMMQEHHSKVKESEYKRAVDELKALQKKHLEDGNSDGYLEASELLTDLKAEQKARQVQQEVTPKQADPRFVQWVDKNRWYAQDANMREFADNLGLAYAQRHPDSDPTEVLDYVTREVRERFKTKFENPKRTQPSSVEGAGSGAPAANKAKFELSQEERKIMNTFLRTGAMTEEQYIAEVKAMRGVK